MPLGLRELRHALLSLWVLADQRFPLVVEICVISEVFAIGVDGESDATSPEPDPGSVAFVVVHAVADDVWDVVEEADC